MAVSGAGRALRGRVELLVISRTRKILPVMVSAVLVSSRLVSTKFNVFRSVAFISRSSMVGVVLLLGC